MDYYEQSCLTVDPPPAIINTNGSFWRQEAPVIVEGKIVKGGMWDFQKTWWTLPNFIKVLCAGYGAGKTSLACKRIISLAIENPSCPVSIISPSFPIARKTTIPTLRGLLAGKQSIYGSQFWWKFNKTIHEFFIRFHGRDGHIIIASGDDPDSLRGPNLAAGIIDEPFIQSEEVFQQMIARIRHPDAAKRELGLTGTPEELNWGYDLCVGDLREKNDVGLVQASTRGNLILDQGYVKRLEGVLTPKAAQAYIDGAFVSLTSGAVFYGFDRQVNVLNLPRPEGCTLGVGMDFNVNPMAAAVFWQNGNYIHIFDEIELPNADTEYMCSYLRDKYGTAIEDVYPDASGAARHSAAPAGKTDFWYIRSAGFNIVAPHAAPKRRDRYNATNGKFAPKQGKPTLSIAPNCTKLIKYLELYSHEKMNEPEQKRYSHLCDAATYPLIYLFPVDKEERTVKLSGY